MKELVGTFRVFRVVCGGRPIWFGGEMEIHFVQATPELRDQYKALSGSNATDFVCFDVDHYSLIALDGDRPVALIVAKQRCLAEPLHMIKEAFIDIIEVLPDYQRRGIGTALVARVITWAQENEIAQIRAWSEEVRQEALLLWNKMGFTFSRVDFPDADGKRYGFYAAKRL